MYCDLEYKLKIRMAEKNLRIYKTCARSDCSRDGNWLFWNEKID